MFDWEILVDKTLSRRAIRFLQMMVKFRPERTVISSKYTGTAKHLMLYGPGAPHRIPVIQEHRATGGHVAMWDLGYWSRESAMRLSFDGMHPTPAQIAASPAQGRRGFELREDADPAGPILLIGLGRKAVVAYDLQPFEWERAALRRIQEKHPGREVIWRPKGSAGPLAGLRMDSESKITDLLKGASLVVCRHSNVAVDACIAGVPVECDDGAALTLYKDNPNPTPEQRLEFLNRLSWWEWDRSEADRAWMFIRKLAKG